MGRANVKDSVICGVQHSDMGALVRSVQRGETDSKTHFAPATLIDVFVYLLFIIFRYSLWRVLTSELEKN